MSTPTHTATTVLAPDLNTDLAPVSEAAPAPARAKRKRSHAMRNLLQIDGVWHFKKVIRRVETRISLGTRDKELAKAKRDGMERKAIAGELAAIKAASVRRVTSTIGEACAAYENGIAGASDGIEPTTVRANVNALKAFVRWARGSAAGRNEELNVEAVSLEELTAENANRFKVHYLAPAGEDRVALAARRRGAESVLRQARSMFSDQARSLYGKLVLPDLAAWRTATLMKVEDRVHMTIEERTRGAMHEAITALREERPQLWLIHTLTKVAGLRNEELCQARVEWFQRAPWGQVFLSVVTRPYFEPKGSEGHVPIAQEVARELHAFVKDKQPEDFLIQAPHPTARKNLVNLEHAQWIRAYLPAARFAKAGYELRRLGAQVMENRYGREAAAAFLRHAPKGVAERHYLERFFPWRRFGEDVGIRWADVDGRQAKDGKRQEEWKAGAAALDFSQVQAAEVKLKVKATGDQTPR